MRHLLILREEHGLDRRSVEIFPYPLFSKLSRLHWAPQLDHICSPASNCLFMWQDAGGRAHGHFVT